MGTLFLSAQASALEYKLEPSVQARTSYNTNLFMNSQRRLSATEVLLAPRMTAGVHAETWDATATGRVEFARFPGKSGLDTNDRFLDIDLERRMERSKVRATAGLSRDTTNRIDSFDLDTGLVTTQIDRKQRSLSLSVEYSLTPRWLVRAGWSHLSISYPGGDTVGLTDYVYSQPTASLFYRLDEKWQFFGTLAHSRLDFDNSVNTVSKTNSAQAGVQYDFSERDSLQFSIGRRSTDASFDVFLFGIIPLGRTTTSDSGLVYNGSYTRKFETGSLSVDLSRSTTPSSLGVDTDTTSLGARIERRFSPKLSARLAVNLFQSETIGGGTSANYDRWQVSPSLYWRATERWSINASYAYRRVKRELGGTATGNVWNLALVYRWDPIAASR